MVNQGKGMIFWVIGIILVVLLGDFFFGGFNDNSDIGLVNEDANISRNSLEWGDLNYSTEDVLEDNYLLPIDDYSFNTKAHWGHMPLTYAFQEKNVACKDSQMKRFRLAFSELQRLTNETVSFEELENSELSDLKIICKDILPVTYGGDYKYEELGNAELRGYWDINLITHSNITITKSVSNSGWYPLTEMHEILHSLGYGHDERNFNVMNAETTTGEFYTYFGGELKDKVVSKDLIEDLINAYTSR